MTVRAAPALAGLALAASAMRSSAMASSLVHLSASTRNSTTSASPSAADAVRFMARFKPRRVVQSRRIDEGDLCIGQVFQTDQAMARGLRPRRDDAQLVSDQCIEQRG